MSQRSQRMLQDFFWGKNCNWIAPEQVILTGIGAVLSVLSCSSLKSLDTAVRHPSCGQLPRGLGGSRSLARLSSRASNTWCIVTASFLCVLRFQSHCDEDIYFAVWPREGGGLKFEQFSTNSFYHGLPHALVGCTFTSPACLAPEPCSLEFIGDSKDVACTLKAISQRIVGLIIQTIIKCTWSLV